MNAKSFLKMPSSRLAVLPAALIASALAAPAQAVDLRSWDQKIETTSQRFEVLWSFDNEAVLDKETQLVWERSPSRELRDYRLATGECMRKFVAGRSGWRLPTIQEMRSLLVDSGGDPNFALPVYHPFNLDLGGYQIRYFWSTTQDVEGGWYVLDFEDGFTRTALGDMKGHYWCVRGGS